MLKQFWIKWKQAAKVIGTFQARIIFTLFYFFILWIAGFAVRLWSDPLHTKLSDRKTNWDAWEHPVNTLEEAVKQS